MRIAALILGLALCWPFTAVQAECTGDCGGDGDVTIDELVLSVNIAIGAAPVSQCAAIGAAPLAADDIFTVVGNTLDECAPVDFTPTPTATITPTQAVEIPTPTPCADNDGSATLRARPALPTTGQGNLIVRCVKVENAGGTRTDLTRVTASGTILGVPMEFLVYFVTDTGAIDTVTYSWQPSTQFPGAFDHFVYCNGAACTGASVNLGQLKINLSNVPLASESGESATILGSITLNFLPNQMPTPTPACPGGSLTMNISEATGLNTASPLPSTLTLGTAMNFTTSQPSPTIANFSALYDACPGVFPQQTLGFSFSGFEIAAGTSYSVGLIDSFINQIEFAEAGFSGTKAWSAGSGTLTIDSVDAVGVHFRIVDAKMRPKGLGPTGTFTVNATGVLVPN